MRDFKTLERLLKVTSTGFHREGNAGCEFLDAPSIANQHKFYLFVRIAFAQGFYHYSQHLFRNWKNFVISSAEIGARKLLRDAPCRDCIADPPVMVVPRLRVCSNLIRKSTNERFSSNFGRSNLNVIGSRAATRGRYLKKRDVKAPATEVGNKENATFQVSSKGTDTCVGFIDIPDFDGSCRLPADSWFKRIKIESIF